MDTTYGTVTIRLLCLELGRLATRLWIRHYPQAKQPSHAASSGFGFLKKLAMDGWFAGAAGPFFGPASFGL